MKNRSVGQLDHGDVLTPEHFLQQDRHNEELVVWLLRYCVPVSGLVGGGVRLDAVEQGLAKLDPKVDLVNDGDRLRVSVLRARAITPSGELIDVDESRPIEVQVNRSDLAGISDLSCTWCAGPKRSPILNRSVVIRRTRIRRPTAGPATRSGSVSPRTWRPPPWRSPGFGAPLKRSGSKRTAVHSALRLALGPQRAL